MAKTIAYPIAHGKHGNIHMHVKLKGIFTVKVNAFPETEKAYIMSFKFDGTKINENLKKVIDINLIHNEIKTALKEKDYILMTQPNEIFKRYENTEELLNEISLNEQ